MNIHRGEVVVVDWPLFQGQPRKTPVIQSKKRPALVIQNDKDNARLTNTILAMITSRTRPSAEPTQLFIEISTPEGQQTGLRQDSVVNCINLFTISQIYIVNVVGKFAAATMQKVNECLKAALEIQ